MFDEANQDLQVKVWDDEEDWFDKGFLTRHSTFHDGKVGFKLYSNQSVEFPVQDVEIDTPNFRIWMDKYREAL